MMIRRLAVLVTLACLPLATSAACDSGADPNEVTSEDMDELMQAFIEEAGADYEFDAEPLPGQSEPPPVDVVSGWFTFEVLDTTCERDRSAAWDSSYGGDAWGLSGGELGLDVPLLPVLTGEAGRGDKTLAGEVEWMDESGYQVLCDVAGTAAVGRDGLDGELTERLSSAGPTNCTTTLSFHFQPDIWNP